MLMAFLVIKIQKSLAGQRGKKASKEEEKEEVKSFATANISSIESYFVRQSTFISLPNFLKYGLNNYASSLKSASRAFFIAQ